MEIANILGKSSAKNSKRTAGARRDPHGTRRGPVRGRPAVRRGAPTHLVALAQRDSVILHCHWLSFLGDLYSDIAVIAVIFYQNDNVAHD
jgi:hypothetical protein